MASKWEELPEPVNKAQENAMAAFEAMDVDQKSLKDREYSQFFLRQLQTLTPWTAGQSSAVVYYNFSGRRGSPSIA